MSQMETPDESVLLLDRQLCFLFYRINKGIQQQYQVLLDPLGLTYPQYLLMLALWENDGQSVQELGQRLTLDSGTLSPMITRLELQGRVKRRRTEDDMRVVRIYLSEEGRQLKAKATCIPGQLIQALGFASPDTTTTTDSPDSSMASAHSAQAASHSQAHSPHSTAEQQAFISTLHLLAQKVEAGR